MSTFAFAMESFVALSTCLEIYSSQSDMSRLITYLLKGGVNKWYTHNVENQALNLVTGFTYIFFIWLAVYIRVLIQLQLNLIKMQYQHNYIIIVVSQDKMRWNAVCIMICACKHF